MPKQHFDPLNFTEETTSSKNNHQFFPPEKIKAWPIPNMPSLQAGLIFMAELIKL